MGSRATPHAGRKSQLLRKYPALAFVLVAGVLALLLPTALNVPQSGPSTLAEFAPAPGEAEGRSDTSTLGQASSGGLGFGSGRDRSSGEFSQENLGSPKQRRAALKKCVGSPPRQTEDPLSPPCVAFFDGDNFGSTTKGVTRDEVRAVLWWEGTQGTDPRAGEFVDCTETPASNDTPEDVACKAYTRFFNVRYQTYARIVRIWAFHRPQSISGVVAHIDEKKDPFAIVAVPFTGGSNFAESGAQRKIVGAIYEGAPRERYRRNSPYIIGFRPDIEDGGRLAASYICLKLKDRSARFHGSPIERGKVRRFGFWSSGSSEKALYEGIARELEAQCGLTGVPYVEGLTPIGAGQLREADVTTVIPLGTQGSWTSGTNVAAQGGWFPEWFLPGDPRTRGYDTNHYARFFNQAEWSNAFGLTFDYRRNEASDQFWYRTAREGCPECGEPTSMYAANIYDTFNLLFWGIQAAGPRLSPSTLDKGLHAIPPRGSPNPYKPAAYFGPGNYSFVKDAMEMWWDPTGTPPGDPARGCYRLPNDGERHRTGEWIPGDDDIHRGEPPCQGSTNLGNN